jgi:hypothetical protein|tara:strand:+ start:5288 stop:5713 length:426 start_codon:yes stop_codon:yes gene_type:complete
MKQLSILEIVTLGVLSIFIVAPLYPPAPLSELIDTLLGKLVVLVISLILLSNVKPVIGIVGLYAAFILVYRSRSSILPINNFTALETRKEFDKLASHNQFPVTLEEEVVQKRVPTENLSVKTIGESYKPVYDSETLQASDF